MEMDPTLQGSLLHEGKDNASTSRTLEAPALHNKHGSISRTLEAPAAHNKHGSISRTLEPYNKHGSISRTLEAPAAHHKHGQVVENDHPTLDAAALLPARNTFDQLPSDESWELVDEPDVARRRSSITCGVPMHPSTQLSRPVWAAILVVLALVALLSPVASAQDKAASYFMAGGYLGMVCSSGVMFWYIRRAEYRRHPAGLLFFRTLCSFCIGLTAALYPYWSRGVCEDNKTLCDLPVNSNDPINVNSRQCLAPACLLQFFELASEGWFLCTGLDTRIGMSNPFTDYKDRMFWYHIIAWSLGGISTIILAISGSLGLKYNTLWGRGYTYYDHNTHHDGLVYGFWFITTRVDRSPICWFKSDNSPNVWKFNLWIWVLFYIPIIGIYAFGVRAVFVTFAKLRKGLSKTFEQRLQVVVLNSCNLLVYMTYWIFLAMLYLLSFALEPANLRGSRACWLIVVFGIGGKGFVDALVWLIMQDFEKSRSRRKQKHSVTQPSSVDDDLKPMVNKALQQEILFYATRGIRDCAKNVHGSTSESLPKREYLMVKGEQGSSWNDRIRFFEFLRLVFTLAGQNPNSKLRRAMSSSTLTAQTESVWAKLKVLFASPDDRDSFACITAGEETSFRSLEDDPIVGVFPQTSSENGSALATQGLAGRGNSIQKQYADIDSEMPSGNERLNTPSRRSEQTRRMLQTSARSLHSDANCWRTFYDGRVSRFDGIVRFVEYRPVLFRKVRLAANIDDDQYATAFDKTAKERVTEGGASGAFFFFSGDERFIAKSCTSEEMRTLCRIAPEYTKYMEMNPQTFIVRILGAYSLTLYGNKLNFLVMQNLFFNELGDSTNVRYDIKGSWEKRNAQLPRNGSKATCLHCNQQFIFSKDIRKARGQEKCSKTGNGQHKPNITFKDNDLNSKLNVSRDTAPVVLQQLERDSKALVSFGIMDYSLLIGVCHHQYQVTNHEGELKAHDQYVSQGLVRRLTRTSTTDIEVDRKSTVTVAGEAKLGLGQRLEAVKVVAPSFYYMGIIDMLQEWTWAKQLERAWKVVVGRKDPAGVSAIEPVQYQERFMKRMREIFEMEDDRAAEALSAVSAEDCM